MKGDHPEMKKYELNLDLILQANALVEGKILRTPMEQSTFLSEHLGAPTYFKLEAQQTTGSFKVRGALFYLSTLSDPEKNKGVAACSAGNHGLGVAYAAKNAGITCTVYVPKNADNAKCQKIQKLGAKVVRSDFEGYDDTLEWAKKEVQISGQHFISAFEDERIMAGNGGTIAMEILNAVPDVQNVIFPVGGGGLAGGIAFYFKEMKPSVRLIGCQHIDSPALKLSLECGKAVTALPGIETVAGGIEGGIGELCFEVLKSRIDDVLLLNEQEICEAVRWMLQNHQSLIEPSAVVTVAACLSKSMPKLSGKTVVLLSGRNVAYETLKKLIAEGKAI